MHAYISVSIVYHLEWALAYATLAAPEQFVFFRQTSKSFLFGRDWTESASQ